MTKKSAKILRDVRITATITLISVILLKSAAGTSTDSSVNDVADKTSTDKVSDSQTANSPPNLPSPNPGYLSPDDQNKVARLYRLTTAFDQYYQDNFDSSRNFAKDNKVYGLRRELQALLDMYRATNKLDYLETAKGLVLKAIADAKSNQRTLLWYGQERGTWPCFYVKEVAGMGGHNQLNDFQGSHGFMMVASVLKQANVSGWQEIADFVEQKIIKKWWYYNPNLTFEKLTGSQSNIYLLANIARSRDVREQFAGICLDLSELGYQKYPYRNWSKLLFDIYLTEKTSLDEPYPDALYRSKVPSDWGLYHQADGTLIWSWGASDLVKYGTLDTSHANRTIWAACQAFEKGLLPQKITLNNLIVSFKKNIWVAQKEPLFYFNNMIDGTDPTLSMGPGRQGNVWFGWHRLAAYDESLKALFISLGEDLANGGLNVIGQNKGMKEAPICLIAWAARLISSQGKPEVFP
ncbi:MAG: hypothetical protein PHQ35_04185 [Phycisphaerae bacterium]|nr:hypothetical protein [Phycisphaerae bacterium]MDD5380282.1 hypothetical protein [Phycisphaerae bacterium]